MSEINVVIPTGYVTAEKYSEISGIKLCTVRKMAYDGRLPTMPREKNHQSLLINNAKITLEALNRKY